MAGDPNGEVFCFWRFIFARRFCAQTCDACLSLASGLSMGIRKTARLDFAVAHAQLRANGLADLEIGRRRLSSNALSAPADAFTTFDAHLLKHGRQDRELGGRYSLPLGLRNERQVPGRLIRARRLGCRHGPWSPRHMVSILYGDHGTRLIRRGGGRMRWFGYIAVRVMHRRVGKPGRRRVIQYQSCRAGGRTKVSTPALR